VAKDGKSITFHLRKGVKFSDDSPFTAKDVEFTYKVVTDPSYTGRYGQTTQYVKGSDNYRNKKNKKEPEFPGIQVIDDYTIKFEFTEA
ncbi:ABC transporter substrate-binding protein, partial [Desulfovibrio desulfuricans]